MKSSEAIKKAVDFYKSNGLTVIYRQAGVSPRLVAYDKKTDQVILIMVRRPRSKSYYTRQNGCRNAIGALVAWGEEWLKTHPQCVYVKLESIAVYESGEMDRIFHGSM